MLLLQAALCFIGNGLSLLLIILLFRDARQFIAARIAIPLVMGTIGYSLTLLPPPLRLPDPLFAVAAVANIPVLGLNWLFGRALILDGFRMRWTDWAVLAVTCVLMGAGAAQLLGMSIAYAGALNMALIVASVLIMAHLVWIITSGFGDDLIDTRRTIRFWFLLVVIFSYGIISIIELLHAPIFFEAIVFDVTTIAINMSVLLWATRLGTEKLFSCPKPQPGAPQPARPPHIARAESRLQDLMTCDHVYRDDELTISSLAAQIDLPEHQLRRLINQSLGYRNFSAYLNDYRISEAKESLADREKSALPILTIAMDAGYRSLSTFNRAFRAMENETPSTFRERALLETADRNIR